MGDLRQPSRQRAVQFDPTGRDQPQHRHGRETFRNAHDEEARVGRTCSGRGGLLLAYHAGMYRMVAMIGNRCHRILILQRLAAKLNLYACRNVTSERHPKLRCMLSRFTRSRRAGRLQLLQAAASIAFACGQGSPSDVPIVRRSDRQSGDRGPCRLPAWFCERCHLCVLMGCTNCTV